MNKHQELTEQNRVRNGKQNLKSDLAISDFRLYDYIKERLTSHLDALSLITDKKKIVKRNFKCGKKEWNFV